MSFPETEISAPAVEQDAAIETPPTSVDASSEGAAPAPEAAPAKKPLPTKKDFPTLGSGAFLAAANKVSWGPT